MKKYIVLGTVLTISLLIVLSLVRKLNEPSPSIAPNTHLKSVGLFERGEKLFNDEQYEEAIDYYKQSLAIASSLNNEKSKAVLFTQIGRSYSYLDNNEIAFSYFVKAHKIEQTLHRPLNLAGTHCDLGDSYYTKHDFQNAVHHCSRGLKLFNKFYPNENPYRKDTKDEVLGCRITLGQAYKDLGSFEEAINLHRQSIKESMELGYHEIAASLGEIVSSMEGQ